MKFNYNQVLVLQFPASALKDYDAMIEVEDQITEGLGDLGEVDGHDMGSGEMNIFILTDHPKLAFAKVSSLLETNDLIHSLSAAYREVGKDHYTILHPPGLVNFSIA